MKYTYSDDLTTQASAKVTPGIAETAVTLNKTHEQTYNSIVRGEEVKFSVSGSVSGTEGVEATSLVDHLPTAYYMTPDQIVQQLSVSDDSAITITAQHVRLVKPEDHLSVTTGDGTTQGTTDTQHAHTGGAYDNAPHKASDFAEITNSDATVTFTRTSDGRIQVVCGQNTETVDANGDAVSTLLDNWGYVVQYETTFDIIKAIDGILTESSDISLNPVFATAKDSFMLARDNGIDEDQRNNAAGGGNAVNEVQLVNGDDVIASATSSVSISQEYRIDKDAQVNGEWRGDDLSDDNIVAPGSVVPYRVTVTRTASDDSPDYDALPFEDFIRQAQILLVPANDRNAHLATDYNLQPTEYSGQSYYVLAAQSDTEPTVYKNVWFSATVDSASYDLCADSVTVTPSGSEGDMTLARWYLHTASYGKSSTLQVSYATLADPDATGYQVPSDGSIYRQDNTAYLGDQQGERLFDEVTVPVSKLAPQKRIITDLGNPDDPADDALVTSSVLQEGHEVTYRLGIIHAGDASVELTNKDFYDILPKGISAVESVIFPSGNSGLKVEDGNAWHVSQTAPDSTVTEDNQYYLVWEDSFKLTVSADSYIYVTIKMPDDWQTYRNTYVETGVTNTEVLQKQESSVYHSFEPTVARLQKGVVETSYTLADSGRNSIVYGNGKMLGEYANVAGSAITTENGRSEYVTSGIQYGDGFNRRLRYGFVTYYTTLVNDGNTRLYINDIQDKVPEGFSFLGGSSYGVGTDGHPTRIVLSVAPSGTPWGTTYSYTDFGTLVNNAYTISNGSKSYMAKQAGVHATVSGNDVYFKIDNTYPSSEPLSTNATGNLSYDEERGQYYLNPNEYIGFAYVMVTNDATLDTETNLVAMPFDSQDVNVQLANDVKIESTDFGETQKNDGSSSLEDTAFAQDNALVGTGATTQWLVSSVDLVASRPVPGISKKVYSKTSTSGTETQNPAYASATDTVTWDITARNDGTSPIDNYVISDEIDAPYVYTGAVSLGLNNNSPLQLMNITSWNIDTSIEPDTSKPVTAANALSARFIGTTPDGSMQYMTLTVNGDPVTLKSSRSHDPEVQVRLVRTNEGKLRLDVMPCRVYEWSASTALPAGMVSTLRLSTVNNGEYAGNTLFNSATMTPLTGKEMDRNAVVNGTPIDAYTVHTADGQDVTRAAVTTDAVIPIRDFAGTTSIITVSQTTGEGSDQQVNSATSETSPNYITLADPEKTFEYTLEVTNSSQDALNDITLVNGLPEEDDHYTFYTTNKRDSQFLVQFASDPQVKVQVKTADGEWQDLDSSTYTVEFGTATEFDENDFTLTESDDTRWSDASSFASNVGDISTARSMRIHVNQLNLEPGSSVRAVYEAKVPTQVEGTAIAWNSFGYRATSAEHVLEATPLKVGVRIEKPWTARVAKLAEDYSYTNSEGQVVSGKLYDGTDGEHAQTDDKDVLSHIDALSGAVIGLYSPSKAEALQDLSSFQSNLDEWQLAETAVPLSVEHNGTTYYLKDLQQTNVGAGMVQPIVMFTGLTESEYLVKELKAPSGYTLGENKEIVISSTDTVAYQWGGSSVPPTGHESEDDVDESSYHISTYFTDPSEEALELPSAGGEGIFSFIMNGLAIMAAAAGAYKIHQNKRARG
ncbi:MAG: hypothetical protein ACOX4F_05035 [Atopobiaceae bacterium]